MTLVLGKLTDRQSRAPTYHFCNGEDDDVDHDDDYGGGDDGEDDDKDDEDHDGDDIKENRQSGAHTYHLCNGGGGDGGVMKMMMVMYLKYCIFIGHLL